MTLYNGKSATKGISLVFSYCDPYPSSGGGRLDTLSVLHYYQNRPWVFKF
jgi:hypothetical protein